MKLSNVTPKMHATYKLNEEIENPPMALQIATQIGVLSYDNPAMENSPNKDAIVVLAFGTTYKDTREKTIGATVQAISDAHKNLKVFTAFTSHIIIKRIRQAEGHCDYLTPGETLDKLKREGFTRIALVPLTLVPGMEYKYDVAIFQEYKTQFKKITLATPLMYWQGQQKKFPDDILEVMKALDLPERRKETAILLMAHGTPDPSNAYYSVMQAKLNSLRDDAYIYTVEGYPMLEDLLDTLKQKNYRKVILIPLMMVAGNHALKDMNGEEETSHKNILLRAGFEVECQLKGIGENKKIRDIYVRHATEALTSSC